MFIGILIIISGLRRGLARIDGWRGRLGLVWSGMDGLDGVGAQGGRVFCPGSFSRGMVHGAEEQEGPHTGPAYKRDNTAPSPGI